MENNQPNPHRAIRKPYPDVPLEPGRTAALVIDLQYYDAHRDYGFGRRAAEHGVTEMFTEYFAQVEEMLPRIAALLDKCRENDIEVIYSVIASRTADGRDVSLSYHILDNKVPPTSREAQVLDEIAPKGDEMVLHKTSSSVFNSTPIHQILHNMGIANLIVMGVATAYCVESAVRDASDLGYRVLVVSDCCASPVRAHHDWSLTLIDGIYAQVLPAQRVIERIEQMSAVPAPAPA